MSVRTALLIGACSALATAIGRELAAKGWSLVLAGRDAARLDALAADLLARGAAGAQTERVDLLDVESVDAVFDRVASSSQLPSLVLVAPGVMISNAECLRDAVALRRMVEINFSGVAHCVLRAATLLERNGGGEIMVISSVAGDRGRPKNFCYGSTKAGLDAFLEGLQLSLAGKHVNIVNLKPGPVDTPMNAHVPKGLIWSTPEVIARAACAALGKGRHRVYAPGWWGLVMWVVRLLPGRLLGATGV
jgi:short-subunit dehydrogenase